MSDRIVVGMTGATGQIFGVKALELLQDTEFEAHLILSEAATVTLAHEGNESSGVRNLASESHDNRNIGAAPASGSFRTTGMVLAPCSMKTLSNIAHGNSGKPAYTCCGCNIERTAPTCNDAP